MFREEFATWRQNHVIVSCGYFKNRKPAEGERFPMCSLSFGIARAAEHRDVTRIGLGHDIDDLPEHKPIVVSGSVLVSDRKPQSNRR